MKIGFLGGIAGHFYSLAKAFVEEGYKVVFIRYLDDMFAHNQPVWYDIPFTLTYADVMETPRWSIHKWKALEEKLGWKPPPWFVDYDQLINCKDVRNFADLKIDGPYWVRATYKIFEILKPYFKAVRKFMSECDLLIVNDHFPLIIAAVCGKPFIYIPYGGDIRRMAGKEKFHLPTLKSKVRWFLKSKWGWYVLLKLSRWAVSKALFVGSHDPFGSWGGRDSLDILKIRSLKRIPYPVRIIKQPTPKEKSDIRKKIVSKFLPNLKLQDNIPLIFCPSRIDFKWKGTNIFIEALLSSVSEVDGKLQILFSGWGVDFVKAKDLINSHKLQSLVTFLDFSLSKPVLYEFFKAADLVVDQFVLGSYGATCVESMSVGTPVLMYINEREFERWGFPAPPVLNASNKEEISNLLKKIASGQIDLHEQGKICQQWVEKYHKSGLVVHQIISEYKREISQVKKS